MKVIISAGGTGGHVYPAIAVINKIKKLDKKCEIIYIGTHNRMEKDIIPKMGIQYIPIKIFGFTKSFSQNIKNLFCVINGYQKSKKIMKKFKPDVVIGFGGYVTYPVLKAAKTLNIKSYIHEQNSIPGKSNLAMASMVSKIFISMESSRKHFSKSNQNKIILTGNPCGEGAKDIDKYNKKELGLSSSKKLVVITTGSQGAVSMNNDLVELLHKLGNKKYEVVCVTGKNCYKNVTNNQKYEKNIVVLPYFDNLNRLLKVADLVVSRAGATVISEILSLRVPNILMPSPYVANNHQFYNADYLAKNQATIMLEMKDYTSDLLISKIDYLLNDHKELLNMKKNMEKLALDEGATLIVKELMKNE